MILWGMGISQHVHGTDNARCLIALALMTGQIGRPGTGLHPLRGQNNVQGASRRGPDPDDVPGLPARRQPAARARFEKLWGADALDTKPGLTVVEIMDAVERRHASAACTSWARTRRCRTPTPHHAREALAALEHLVVQDIFLTETAYLADVVLPASALAREDRHASPTPTAWCSSAARRSTRRATRARTCGSSSRSRTASACDWDYGAERRRRGVRRDAPARCRASPASPGSGCEREHAVTYPCANEDDPGQPVVFTDDFPTAGGRRAFVPADIIPADERPDAEYPFVLITGRQLEHWHTGCMTRRASCSMRSSPIRWRCVHPLDLARSARKPGDVVTVASRRGEVALYARADDGTPRGAVFIPFCFYEAAANQLTNAALDPFGKIAELKYCAVRLSRGRQAGAAGELRRRAGAGEGARQPRTTISERLMVSQETSDFHRWCRR